MRHLGSQDWMLFSLEFKLSFMFLQSTEVISYISVYYPKTTVTHVAIHTT